MGDPKDSKLTDSSGTHSAYAPSSPFHPLKSPGSLGVNDYSDPNSGWGTAEESLSVKTPAEQKACYPRTPGPTGLKDRADPNPPISPPSPPLPHVRMVILDLPNVLRLLKSAALARSMAVHTTARWVEYNDSTVINALYTVFFWKEKPGAVEVDTGKREDVQRDSARFYGDFRETFFDKLKGGAAAAFNFLEHAEQIRRASLDQIHSTFRDAQKINQEVAAETTTFIQVASVVKLASDLVIKVGAPPYISIPYSMTCSIIKDYYAAKDANVIAFNTGMEPAKEAGKEAAERGARSLAGQASALQRVIDVADAEIAYVTERLGIQSSLKGRLRKLTQRLNMAEAQKAAGARRLVATNAAKWGLKGIAFGFVAWDVKESFEEFAENIK